MSNIESQDGIVMSRDTEGEPIYRGPAGLPRLTSTITEISDALIHDYVEINELMRDESDKE